MAFGNGMMPAIDRKELVPRTQEPYLWASVAVVTWSGCRPSMVTIDMSPMRCSVSDFRVTAGCLERPGRRLATVYIVVIRADWDYHLDEAGRWERKQVHL